jgi:predicted XRE-type DNA-binding protein
MSKKVYETGSRNVFRDIGIPNAEEHFVKAQLVFKIDTLMKKRGLKQKEAADLFGVRQPDISKMLRGEFRQFSVERLLRFLVALNQDVEIVVKPHRGRNNAPALHVRQAGSRSMVSMYFAAPHLRLKGSEPRRKTG